LSEASSWLGTPSTIGYLALREPVKSAIKSYEKGGEFPAREALVSGKEQDGKENHV
tara:strand:- start:308 stop:475 length:168 start_codon:yes stop_codon:yes gene_type:complete